MMTGEQYRASLDDGRETYFEGEQIGNVATHGILGITVDSAAAGYDRFYKPEPGAVGDFMKVPSSAQELREQVELHETVDLLTHVTYGSIMTLLIRPSHSGSAVRLPSTRAKSARPIPSPM